MKYVWKAILEHSVGELDIELQHLDCQECQEHIVRTRLFPKDTSTAASCMLPCFYSATRADLAYLYLYLQLTVHSRNSAADSQSSGS